jgi:phosphoribosylformylglycinamidine synthase
VAEATRNLACVGAEPLGLTDCLNFGSPERPEIMWQFAESIEGIAEACRALDTPVVSGNVSFYNQTNDVAILPTPTVAVVGQLRSLDDRVGAAFRRDGDAIVLLGETAEGCLGGSEYAFVRGWPVSGPAPRLDLGRERALQHVVREAARARLLASAHDCSEGGLAVCVAESCVLGEPRRGARIGMVGALPGHRLLFGEDASRAIVSVARANLPALEASARAAGVPFAVLGEVGGDRLVVQREGAVLVDVAVAHLAEAHESGLERALAHTS